MLTIILITVADPGFSRGGGANYKRSYYLAIFSQKLHEIERIWTPGGARPWRPLRSANVLWRYFQWLSFDAIFCLLRNFLKVGDKLYTTPLKKSKTKANTLKSREQKS